ncbi:type I-C CRISPR-associated endonuclease Cas1 [Rhodobacteraceae bacterium RKSG542]|uniref:type I-C CRISPR-associated endonuclease Cas1c n=1 Tax=Pseudovibrio flavus TaxID=2529854 RepID=UPI0012BD5D3C|nr:type I-C CRISPR-associated endonuclease Cas1c [Pseudovibrio flavus]MTI15916.1 type I-C CRISPR-associated endonuclease Cas1 [Pseudovibrio flavus]
MKKFLNTLYITSEGAWARKDGANIVVQVDGHTKGRVPLHLLSAVVCFGNVGLSPQLMHACSEAGISITFLSLYGKFLARVEGPVSGNVLLRRAQHKQSLEAPITVARNIVVAKIANQRSVLRRAIRDYSDESGQLAAAEARLTRAAREADNIEDLEQLRGLEGEAANAYFSVFKSLIRAPDIAFNGRSRRPPLDEANALLSFLYVLLAADCRTALESVGLDPQMGFLHADRPGRASLALDLMEEFRAPLADRVCLSLINRRQISSKDFQREETGAVLLKEDSRKVVLEAWQERKRTALIHPFLEEQMALGLFPFMQAQLLARHLRGDLDGYPSFIWR